MANIFGTDLTLLDSYVDDQSTLLQNPFQVATAEINGTTFVYATANVDDALQIFTLDASGELTPVGSVSDTAGTSLDGASSITTFEIGGTPFVLAGGIEDNGITLYTATDSAPYLTFADAAFQSDDSNYNIARPWDIEIVTVSGGTFAYVTGDNADGVSVFEVAPEGSLTSVQNVDDDDNATLEIDAPFSAEHFTHFGSDYLAVSGRTDDGVSVFSISSSTGELTPEVHVGSTRLNGAWEIDSFQVGNHVYLYVASEFADAISVLRFDGASLNIVQSISSSAEQNAPLGARVIEIGDRAMVAVHAFDERQVNLYEIDTNPLSGSAGQLTPLQSLEDGSDGGLYHTRTGAVVEVDGTLMYLATGANSNAVNVYGIGGGDDQLEGTNGADTIGGLAGDDTLFGLGGDDQIEGGTGADRVEGGSGDDLMRGDGGSDWMHGGSDNDTMAGNAGEETMRGGDGDDRMFGGNDSDTLAGNMGDDYLRGDDGNDSLYGGSGNDDMDGGDGNDMVHGGLGDDILRGGSGDDSLIGSYGADILAGNDGDDVLEGGVDDDSLFGGLGNDTLRGDSGADDLRGDSGDDVMAGNDGNDIMRGGTDNDRMFGGTGADTLAGNDGDDVLDGGTDDDRLIGGAGQDLMYGGAGADVFVWSSASESPWDARDTISDFTPGEDLIDISAIHPSLAWTPGGFTGVAGQVWYSDTTSTLWVDMTGSGGANFGINLDGTPALDAGDLIL